MKKLLNVLLILTVIISNLFPANVLAATVRNDNTGEIIITNAVEDETYSIFEIFEIVSYDEETKEAEYRVLPEWEEFIKNYKDNNENKYFELSNTEHKKIDGNTHSILYNADETFLSEGAEDDTTSIVQKFAQDALAYANEKKISATKSIKATSDEVPFTGLSFGYYLVDSSLGVLCGLTNTNPTETIIEKNMDKPETTKSIVVADGDRRNTSSNNIGDTIKFELVISGAANKSKVVASDTLSNGLTLLTNSILATCGEETVTEYSLVETANGFELRFEDEVFKGNTKDVVITYNAILNENARINDANTNEFHITYGNGQRTDSTTVSITTYEFTLRKTDTEDNELTGAVFELRQTKSEDRPNAKNELIYVVEKDGYYMVCTSGVTGAVNQFKINNNSVIKGLSNGEYELTEITPPEGYNKLGAPINFIINDSDAENELNYKDSTLSVVNTTGIILPSTGGMGTVLFITVGSIMALGFGVNLVTKARMRKIED